MSGKHLPKLNGPNNGTVKREKWPSIPIRLLRVATCRKVPVFPSNSWAQEGDLDYIQVYESMTGLWKLPKKSEKSYGDDLKFVVPPPMVAV